MSLTVFEPALGQERCTCLILARDNAQTIRRALDSALGSGCFDRILVLMDIRSRDGTGRIVQRYSTSYPIEIIPFRWSEPPDFAEARNYLNLRVRTPYGFWLDADEEIIDADSLRTMLAAANGQAFSMTVRSPLPGGRNFDMYQPRLFPVKPGVIFECPVFERLDWSLKRMGVPIINTRKTVILHSGYRAASLVDTKNRRNIAILRHALPYHSGVQREHMQEQRRRLA